MNLSLLIRSAFTKAARRSAPFLGLALSRTHTSLSPFGASHSSLTPQRSLSTLNNNFGHIGARLNLLGGSKWTEQNSFVLNHRTLFIQTQSTPNPRSLKFMPGKPVLQDDGPMTASFDQSNRVYAKKRAPLAYTLLLLEGVTNVMFGNDFISVTIAEGADWVHIKPHVFAAISDAFAEGSGALLREVAEEAPSSDTPVFEHAEEDAEVIALIKEIIDTRIRPSVMEDGGDIEFVKFDEGRIVWLKMMGSCSGCPSSGATLKQGIQNMLRYYVEEVAGVEEYLDVPLETVSADALSKLEQSLEAAKDVKPSDK